MKILGKAYQAAERQLRRFRALFIFLALAAIGSVMLFMSWRRWADILIDFGAELYVPWQVSNGKVLYKDIAYHFGPLSPYLNAFLFKVFGVHLMTIAVFNIVLVLTLAIIIYRLFLKITDRITAAAVGATFLALFAFSQYTFTANYNFICPYAHGLTHGIVLSFSAVYLFSVYLEQRKNLQLFLIGALMGLVFFTKSEVFLAVFPAICAGTLLAVFVFRPTALNAPMALGYLCSGFWLVAASFLLVLARGMPFSDALQNSVFPYAAIFKGSITANIFYRHIMGIDDPFRNLLKLALVALWYAAAILDLGLMSFCIKRFSRKNFIVFGGIVAAGVLFFLQLCLMVTRYWAQLFRPLPLVALVFVISVLVLLCRRRNDAKEQNRLLALFVVAVFAFLLLLKMVLNARIYHIGFVLAMPATLLLAAALVYHLPILLGRISGESLFVRILSLVLLGAVLAASINISMRLYSLKTYAVGSGLDTVYDFGPQVSMRGPMFKRAIDQIEKIVGKDESFVVLPEGAMLNYFTRRVNPAPYNLFIPQELEFFGNGRILDSLVKAKPDYVVLVDRDVSEHGCKSFGKDCAQGIFKWYRENYSPVSEIGSMPFTGKGFGIVISKRVLKVP